MRCLHAAHSCYNAEGSSLVVEHRRLGWAMQSPRMGFGQLSAAQLPVLTATPCGPSGKGAPGGM